MSDSTRFRCPGCRKWFTKRKSHPHQRYCNAPLCQRVRKTIWQQENYIPHTQLDEAARLKENRRCRDAMRRNREATRLCLMVGIASGDTVTATQAAQSAVLLLGLISMFADIRDPESVSSFCIEAERRGHLLAGTTKTKKRKKPKIKRLLRGRVKKLYLSVIKDVKKMLRGLRQTQGVFVHSFI